MGVMHKNTTLPGTSLPTTTETVIYTTPSFQVGPGQVGIAITGTVNITPGTSATGVILRVRQGSITGPVVSGAAPSHAVSAGAAQSISFGVTDMSTFTEAAPSGGAYVLTAQQVGATGNGAANVVDVEVEV